MFRLEMLLIKALFSSINHTESDRCNTYVWRYMYIFHSVPICDAISITQCRYVMIFLSLTSIKWYNFQQVLTWVSEGCCWKVEKRVTCKHTLKSFFLNNHNFFNNVMYKYINKSNDTSQGHWFMQVHLLLDQHRSIAESVMVTVIKSCL